MDNKDKKKTLTISSGFKKKIDTKSFQKNEGKKSFSVIKDKKKNFKNNRSFNKSTFSPTQFNQGENKNKSFARKFAEQQATKAFIKKEEKPSGKSKLKLKTPIDKRDFKLTVSRALNVEEIEKFSIS
jgi:hypothetical protein